MSICSMSPGIGNPNEKMVKSHSDPTSTIVYFGTGEDVNSPPCNSLSGNSCGDHCPSGAVFAGSKLSTTCGSDCET